MNHLLLNSDIQEFINLNIDHDISKLALQKNPFPNVSWIEVLNQIAAKKKAREKLPNWFHTKNIIYPTKISVEQTSSEKTAHYKAQLVSGENLIDLTGGFGVDTFYFAKKVKNVVHCEINPELSDVVKHNFEQLKSNNITCYNGDSAIILKELKQHWDCIYIDPSRRNETKGKVFILSDCLPNVPENLDIYFNNANVILIKTAPLLDIAAGLSELKNVKKIHIIALENEVKEVVWELNKGYSDSITITTTNILKESNETFEFILNQHQFTSYSLPQKYLYEPNSAIMKSGGFEEVGTFYNVNKLHKHSHLYTSKKLILFPGRVFEILNEIPYSKTEMKLVLENTKANITTRNFPDTVEKIRKKWKIKEGGNSYCFFTTNESNQKIVLICRKIK